MKVTRAPEAEANLLAALQASPAFTGVAFPDQGATPATWGNEMVYLTDTTFAGDWRGTNCRDDDFTITAVVQVRKQEGASSVRGRCWTLTSAVGDVIYADPYLGGALNVAAEVAGGTVTSYLADDNTWESRAELRIHGVATIDRTS